jgi:thiol-disulfide isomerase/thioredoxin
MDTNNSQTKIVFFIICFIAIVAFGYFYFIDNKKPGQYDAFADCITNSGTKFYGAFWCPHCQKQKADFGRSASKLPYIECSAPNGKDLLPVCAQAEITSFPTWIFPDGSRVSGEQTFETLSEKTFCPIN